MIVVYLSDRGVEEIRFHSAAGTMDDPSLWLWPVVKRELSRLDESVRREASRLAAKLTGEAAG